MFLRPVLFLTVVLLSPWARADRWTFFEGHVGGTAQAVDAEFRDHFGPSLVAGLRTGAFYCPPDDRRIGWEVSADFTLFDYQKDDDADVFRLRLLGGARMEKPLPALGQDVRLIYRLLGGLDYIISSVTDNVFGTETKEEDGALGPVIEPGVGLVWQLDEVLVGATATLPISYHRDKSTADDTADFDYFGVELDLLFTIGASL